MSSGTCSRNGTNIHTEGGVAAVAECSSIMLFGVRLTAEGNFRKSVSMCNLSQLEHSAGTPILDHPNAVESGYASDDVVHQSGHGRERKRGIPWTEEEHRLFLLGLQKVGKGDWRGISRNFVRTRTPTQVASHAQKYFLRQSNQNRRRRRSSLFDITTNLQFVGPSASDESQAHQEITASPTFLLSLASPENGETPVESHRTAKPVRPIPVIPITPLSKMAALDLNSWNSAADLDHDHMPLSLKLPTQDENSAPQPSPSSGSASFQEMSKGESMISVAGRVKIIENES